MLKLKIIKKKMVVVVRVEKRVIEILLIKNILNVFTLMPLP